MTQYEQALHLIEKTAKEWDSYFAYNLARDNELECKCQTITTYDQLLSQILEIYGVKE